MFVHTVGNYTTKPEEYKYKKTRRGVDATCKVYDTQGKLVATLFDEASAIVARVDFVSPEAEQAFEAVAKAAMPDEMASMVVSEFIRKLTQDAEKAWAASWK